MNPESKRPIEIEDLLRLKRAERPPGEFWAEFDRRLRAKQLAALVAKRPWWQRVPRLFTGFSRYHVSLGAAAVLAVGYITLRDEPTSLPIQQSGVATRAPSVPAAARTDTKASIGGESAAKPASNVSLAESEVLSRTVTATHVSSAPASLASEATAPGELSGIIPLLGVSRGVPASNYIAASLGTVSGGEPALATNLLATNSFETRATARPAVEPLQQMTPPGERGRARLLNAMVAMVSNETPNRTGERAASRLDEDRLSDQVRRLGARGDRVMWKF